MRPRHRAVVTVTAATVAVAFLTVCVPVFGVAGASSVATGSSGPGTLWAYGALRSVGWSGAAGRYVYNVAETVGFAVILNESPVSGNATTLHTNRTMGVLLSVQYCRPSCAHPTIEATIGFHAWESVDAVLNLATNGSVEVGTTPVQALALVSSKILVQAGIHEAAKVVDNGTIIRSHNLSVALQAGTTTAFSPALGLIPVNVSPSETWTSVSAFSEVGNASWSVLERLLGGVVPINTSGNVSLTQVGEVVLDGSTGPTVRLGGTATDALLLRLDGPFSLREGFLLVPSGADLFGAARPTWLTALVAPNGSANASQSAVDVNPAVLSGAHLGFDGSELVWTSATSNPAPTLFQSAGAGLEPAVVSPAASANSTSVQGGPESVGQATTDQNCLAGGVGCPVAGSPRGPWGALILLGAVVVVAAVAAVLIVDRRRIPPPKYPNASLYPPAGRSAASPDVGPRPTPPTPPGEDDPLSHLW